MAAYTKILASFDLKGLYQSYFGLKLENLGTGVAIIIEEYLANMSLNTTMYMLYL